MNPDKVTSVIYHLTCLAIKTDIKTILGSTVSYTLVAIYEECLS